MWSTKGISRVNDVIHSKRLIVSCEVSLTNKHRNETNKNETSEMT